MEPLQSGSSARAIVPGDQRLWGALLLGPFGGAIAAAAAAPDFFLTVNAPFGVTLLATAPAMFFVWKLGPRPDTSTIGCRATRSTDSLLIQTNLAPRFEGTLSDPCAPSPTSSPPAARMQVLPGASGLDQRDPVVSEDVIPGHNRQSFNGRLRDEEAVEGISVVRRQPTHLQHMREGDCERLRSKLAFEFSADVLDRAMEDDLPQGGLDRELPWADDAEPDLVRAEDRVARGRREGIGFRDRPEGGMDGRSA